MFSISGTGIGSNEIVTMRPNITESEILCQVIAISMRHHLTYVATIEIFNMMISITNSGKLPSTKRSLWATLLRNDQLTMVHHLYCRICHSNIGEGTVPNRDCACGKCGPDKPENSLSYFIQVSLKEQSNNLFSVPGIVDSLQYRYRRKKKNANGIEDIYDGMAYKKECEPGGFLSSEYNYSFTLNTDGCKVSNSSNASAWPVLLTVNELPPHLRKRNMLLAGIWVDNTHPNLNSLLFPSVKELHDLYTTGITWKPTGTDTVTSKFVTLMCVVDSIARPALLNMTQFNGEYGCTFCYAKGKGDGPVRTYSIEENAPARTDEEIRRHMKEAREINEKVLGVKGTSVLKALPKFDLARGMIVESMHNVYLGATKQHILQLMFGKATDPWYRGTPKLLAVVNSRLKNIRPPSRISRKPRNLETAKQWKASEWRNLLLYYGTICLRGVIRDCDLEHFTLLSQAAYILNKDSISTAELQGARLLLEKYVILFNEIFGERYMTFNIHLLNHLTDTVENWGPLWANSAFPFESMNKQIIDSVTSSTGRPLQIVTRFLMNRFMESHMYDERTPKLTKRRIHSILTSGKKSGRIKSLNALKSTGTECKVLGKTFSYEPSPWQLESLHATCYRPSLMLVSQRAMIKSVEYSCRKQNNNTQSCNKFVFVRNMGFGEILNIVQFHHNGGTVCGLFIQCFDDLGATSEAQHIRRLAPTAHRAFITVDDTEGPAIIAFEPDGTYGIKLANVFETD